MAWQDAKRYAQVDGRRMAYVERGNGSPIVLLHGNPTSSYLWRSVLPKLEELGRCIAPDLIGMGDSDKLAADDERRYTFMRHRQFLDALLDQLGVTRDVTLVIHDWGSVLGFDWAHRHPDRVRAIVYMEAFVTPLTWDDYDPGRREVFERLRSPAGEKLVLEDNLFVEAILPDGIQRTLAEEEMKEYRRPFRALGEDRLPTLVWPRQIPIGDEPPEVAEVVRSYSRWLARSEVPKLFINADPGALLTGRPREVCRTWPNQTEVTIAGKHVLPEDSPKQIARAIRQFISGNRPREDRGYR
jgi:haloalkane dehalogenase